MYLVQDTSLKNHYQSGPPSASLAHPPIGRDELVTVIGSNHFSLDEYIKQYLLQPDLPFISFIKIGLRYYITPELIVQLKELKEYLNIPSYEVFYKHYAQFKS